MKNTPLARRVAMAVLATTLFAIPVGSAPAAANGDFEQTYFQACLFAGALTRVSSIGTSVAVTIDCGRGTPVVLLAGDASERGTHFGCLYAGSLSQVGSTAPSSCGRGTVVAFASGSGLYGCLFRGSLSQIGEKLPTKCGRGTPSMSFGVVTGVNPPKADDIAMSAAPSVPLEIELVASDIDSDDLTFEIVDSPGSGVLDTTTPAASCVPVGVGVVCTATVTYTGAFATLGPDVFTYRVNDGLSDSVLATVSLTLEYPPTRTWNVDSEEGGTFEWPGHVIIIFESGSLTCDAILSVTPGLPSLDNDDPPASNSYDITLVAADPPNCPGGPEIGPPATIGIHYDPTAIILPRTTDDLYLGRYISGDWNVFPYVSIDLVNNIVYTDILALSKWNVFVG